MSFNLLAMLYMQATQSKKNNRQANLSSTKRSIPNLSKTEPAPTLVKVRGASTINTQIWKVEKICRVCGDGGYISIFDNTQQRNIVKDITTIASVEIKENDGLPSQICAACLNLLDNALLFKRRCEKMDTELHAEMEKMEQARIKEEESLDKNEELHCDEILLANSDSFCSIFANEIENSDILDVQIEEKEGFVDCQKCNMCFMDSEEYKTHLSTCEKLLKKRREMIHSKLPWLCDICGKGFKQKQNFSSHRMVHTDDLPFSCDMCPYRARNKNTLCLHIRVHTGERPYKCPHCPQTFINASNRKRHQTVHETQRRYKCSICHKGIATKQALKDHEQSVHFGIKAYKCEICDTYFSTKKNVLKHRIRIHKVRARHPKSSTYLQLEEREKEKQRSNARQDEV